MRFSVTSGQPTSRFRGAAGLGPDVGVSALVRKFGILFGAIALVSVGGWLADARGRAGTAWQLLQLFIRDVLPILQDHCQSCHRSGEVAPMPLVTYEQTRRGRGRWRMRSR